MGLPRQAEITPFSAVIAPPPRGLTWIMSEAALVNLDSLVLRLRSPSPQDADVGQRQQGMGTSPPSSPLSDRASRSLPLALFLFGKKFAGCAAAYELTFPWPSREPARSRPVLTHTTADTTTDQTKWYKYA